MNNRSQEISANVKVSTRINIISIHIITSCNISQRDHSLCIGFNVINDWKRSKRCLVVSMVRLASRPAPVWLVATLLTVCWRMDTALANFEHTCSGVDIEWRPHRHGKCGNSLRETVDTMCRFFAMPSLSKFLVKRDTSAQTSGKMGKMGSILLNKKEAMSYLTKREAHQSITCECCYHSCSYMELLQYCNVPERFFRGSRRQNRQDRQDNRRGSTRRSQRRERRRLEHDFS